jgi:hypothetical protein
MLPVPVATRSINIAQTDSHSTPIELHGQTLYVPNMELKASMNMKDVLIGR